MTIGHFLQKTGKTYRKFAYECKVSASYLSELDKGISKKNPSPAVVKRIIGASEGLITKKDLVQKKEIVSRAIRKMGYLP